MPIGKGSLIDRHPEWISFKTSEENTDNINGNKVGSSLGVPNVCPTEF
jgi:hypothetical protein